MRDELLRIREKYVALENDPRLSVEGKAGVMLERRKATQDVLVKYHVNKEQVRVSPIYLTALRNSWR